MPINTVSNEKVEKLSTEDWSALKRLYFRRYSNGSRTKSSVSPSAATNVSSLIERVNPSAAAESAQEGSPAVTNVSSFIERVMPRVVAESAQEGSPAVTDVSSLIERVKPSAAAESAQAGLPSVTKDSSRFKRVDSGSASTFNPSAAAEGAQEGSPAVTDVSSLIERIKPSAAAEGTQDGTPSVTDVSPLIKRVREEFKPGNAADNDNALNSYIAKHMQEMKEIIKEVPMASLEFTTIKLSPVVRKERFDHMQKLIEKLEENFSVSMV